jgi:hypothetical protein
MRKVGIRPARRNGTSRALQPIKSMSTRPPIWRPALLLSAVLTALVPVLPLSSLSGPGPGQDPDRGFSAGFGSSPGPSQQEIAGVVQDPTGQPVVGARVELRVGGQGVRSTFVEPDGRFRLLLPSGATEVTLRVERLGFAERTVALELPMDLGRLLRIQMEPDPLPLPGFRIEVAPEACPPRSQQDGLALWSRMTARHPDGLDTLGAATYTLVRVDTLAGVGAAGGLRSDPSGRGPLRDSDLQADGQRGFSGRLRLAWERRLDRDGYAFPIRRTDAEGSYSTWSYAPLEADFASHFATPLFLRHHRLRSPSPTDGGGWLLSFCPVNGNRPGLEGHMEISADTLLDRVEWRFRTPDPDEEAGGWARFPTPVRPDDAPRLLPLESMTWRRLRSGDVVRRAQWYEAWLVTPGDSVPFLPDRVATDPGAAPPE